MLNLAQTRKIIQSPKSGKALGIIEGYKQLEANGWQKHSSVHPTENVRIYTLGIANLRHDVTLEHDWIVCIGNDVYGFDGDIEAITQDVMTMLEELEK